MKVLVLGGTRFVGRHIVEAALREGHSVDVFARGRTPAPEGARLLVGDRDGDLSALDGRWDAVVDVSAYVPRQVREATKRLSGRAGRYLFISTGSVYEHWDDPETVEDAALMSLDDPATETITAETYGGLKVACERVAAETFAGSVLSVRPTFVVGPHDYTDRFTSWLRRVRDRARVAAPGSPDVPVAFVDARDLARFVVHLAGSDDTGAVNASGPAEPATWGSVLDAARQVTASRAEIVWLPASFLEGRDLGPDPFPMAIPFTFRGARRFSLERALALGLTHTPLADTLRDTIAWDDTEGVPRAGITEDEEDALLAAYDAAEVG